MNDARIQLQLDAKDWAAITEYVLEQIELPQHNDSLRPALRGLLKLVPCYPADVSEIKGVIGFLRDRDTLEDCLSVISVLRDRALARENREDPDEDDEDATPRSSGPLW